MRWRQADRIRSTWLSTTIIHSSTRTQQGTSSMSYMKSLVSALNRSVEMARQSTVSALRMDVAPTARSEGALPLWGMASAEHIKNFATGSDSDIGGLSTCKLALDQEGKGRFFGTLSTEIPRGGKIERSGYAGFRNRVSGTASCAEDQVFILLLTHRIDPRSSAIKHGTRRSTRTCSYECATASPPPPRWLPQPRQR